MQPQSANAFNFNDPHASAMGGSEYEKPGSGGSGGSMGVYRTETNYTNGSMEKTRGGVYADAQSVHSIPPAYANGGHGQQGYHNNNNNHNNAGDMSGATLFGDEDGSNADGHQPIHHMLTNVNTGLSSFKPVPPPGSKSAPMPRVDESSYPPRIQSHDAMRGQERSGTPLSARGQQQQYADQQQHQQQSSRHQYYQQDQYQQQQQQPPPPRSYSRNGPSNQQQQSPYSNNRHVPPSPACSQATSGSGRSRHEEAYAATPQDYFTPREGTIPTSPTGPVQQYPAQAAAGATTGAGHRYRMPPQSRRAQSPPINDPAAAYHNPYAAFAQDDDDATSNAHPAGQGAYTADYRNEARQQQQQQPQYRQQRQDSYQGQQQYDDSDSYFPAQSRHQPQQESYSAPYNNYRRY